MEESIIFAKKYLEDMLSFFGLNTDVYATSSDGEVIELHVPSTHLNGFLIGQNAETLRSLQYIVSMALRNKDHAVVRVNIDVADYKKQRAHRLEETAISWLESVKKTGKPMHLQPMNAADRRTIHKLAEEHGLVTASEGFGAGRHIVLQVAGTDTAAADASVNVDTQPSEADGSAATKGDQPKKQ
jgi:spoIIIJ-associated protein